MKAICQTFPVGSTKTSPAKSDPIPPEETAQFTAPEIGSRPTKLTSLSVLLIKIEPKLVSPEFDPEAITFPLCMSKAIPFISLVPLFKEEYAVAHNQLPASSNFAMNPSKTKAGD